MKCLAARKPKELDKIKSYTINASMIIYHLATVSVLAEKYGFGEEKIEKIKSLLGDRAESINGKYIDIFELEEILLDEYGINFNEYFPPVNTESMGTVITSTGSSAIIRFYVVGLASILTDKFGYSKQKVQQIIKSILNRADEIIKHEIDVDYIEKMLIEKYGRRDEK